MAVKQFSAEEVKKHKADNDGWIIVFPNCDSGIANGVRLIMLFTMYLVSLMNTLEGRKSCNVF
jgi:hypothetical protein